jgi:hypothetical protein
MLGYSSTLSAHQFWDLERCEIVETKNFVFHEKSFSGRHLHSPIIFSSDDPSSSGSVQDMEEMSSLISRFIDVMRMTIVLTLSLAAFLVHVHDLVALMLRVILNTLSR